MQSFPADDQSLQIENFQFVGQRALALLDHSIVIIALDDQFLQTAAGQVNTAVLHGRSGDLQNLQKVVVLQNGGDELRVQLRENSSAGVAAAAARVQNQMAQVLAERDDPQDLIGVVPATDDDFLHDGVVPGDDFQHLPQRQARVEVHVLVERVVLADAVPFATHAGDAIL